MTVKGVAHTAPDSTPSHPTILSVQTTNPMRYNPSTDRATSIDEIAAQCKAAILKADQEHDRVMNDIADLLFSDRICWEDDVLIAA